MIKYKNLYKKNNRNDFFNCLFNSSLVYVESLIALISFLILDISLESPQLLKNDKIAITSTIIVKFSVINFFIFFYHFL